MKRLKVCQIPLPWAKQTNLRRNSARAKTLAPSRDSVVPLSGTDGTVAPLILTWRRSVKPKPLMADRLILSMTSPFEATTVKKFWPFPRLNVPVNVCWPRYTIQFSASIWITTLGLA